MRLKGKEEKNYGNVLGGLGCIIAILVVLLSQTMMNLNNSISDLSEIQYISSSTQRCVRMAMYGEVDQQLVFQISTQIENDLSMDSLDKMTMLDTASFVEAAINATDNWHTIAELLSEEQIDNVLVNLAGDNHFNSMTILANQTENQIDELNTKLLYLQVAIGGVILLVGAVVTTHFFQTSLALKENKQIAALASVDTATGLFNRSKCQDLFKTKLRTAGLECDAIIVVDLNDLKKTNDQLGHRVGDELISSFATILKEACEIHAIKPFVGRYGGDEFIIYYHSVESESEVKQYIEEVEYRVDQFNRKEKKFSISYAAGYKLNNSLVEELTIRQLFDKADEFMYQNKVIMKQKRLEEVNNNV